MKVRSSGMWFFLLAICIVISFIADVSLGSVHIPFSDILKTLGGNDSVKSSWYHIVWDFRLPKAVTAVLVGMGLSVSGLLMQTMFRNPLAGPFVLGISSGASLGVALVLLGEGLLFISSGLIFSKQWLTVIAASLGSAGVLLVVMAVSLRVKDNAALLIIGLMFASLIGAILSVLQFFTSADQLQLFIIWTFGSLGGLGWTEIGVLAPVVLIGLGIALTLLKPLNAFLLGENYARSMGISTKKSRLIIIISTSLLAGSITAFCGPIAFIGLAVPHLARMLFNSSDHKILLPATMLCGILAILVCDIISQLPGSQEILPINAVTSLIGAPVVIWIIVRRRKLGGGF